MVLYVLSAHIPFWKIRLTEDGFYFTNKDNVMLYFLSEFVIFSMATDNQMVVLGTICETILSIVRRFSLLQVSFKICCRPVNSWRRERICDTLLLDLGYDFSVPPLRKDVEDNPDRTCFSSINFDHSKFKPNLSNGSPDMVYGRTATAAEICSNRTANTNMESNFIGD